MGNKLTCDCNSHLSKSTQHQQRVYRFWAELFRLSPDGLRWEIVQPSLLLVSVAQAMNCLSTQMTAATAFNETVFSTVITPESCVRRHSDCFVYWRSAERAEMFALNVVSPLDADTFCQMTSVPQPAASAQLHVEVAAEVGFADDRVVLLAPQWSDCIANLAVHELRIHRGNDPNDVYAFKLRHCQCYMEEQGQRLYLVSDANVFVARGPDPRLLREFLDRVLRNSTLRLMNTTTTETARLRLQQMLAAHNAKLQQLLSEASDVRHRGLQAQVDVLCLRNFFLETRLASLSNSALPSPESLFRRVCPETLRLLPPEARLSALFLLYAHKVTSLGSSAETAAAEILCVAALPEAGPQRSPELGPVPDPSTLDSSTLEEYSLEKGAQKPLGLTICAHLQEGRMVAEVTGRQESSGARVGDEVLAVDGTPISGLRSASEAELLLRKGRVLRMRHAPRPVDKDVEKPARNLMTASIREEKLQKSICELVDTEKAFVADLDKVRQKAGHFTGRLVRQYARVAQLPILESAEKLLKVQSHFLEDLVDAAGDLAPSAQLSGAQVKDATLRISALFVNKCAKFKVYSEYSAAYLRFQQTITKQAGVREKLLELNASGEQKEGVESLMIKPIQRVLKYPLFLEQMVQSCGVESVERRQAAQALHRVQALASYVNEMQRLQEEYGALFEAISRANRRLLAAHVSPPPSTVPCSFQAISIDFSQLLMFAHLKWLNADDKKASECVAFVFSTLILICPHKNKAKNCRILPVRDIEVSERDSASGSEAPFVFMLVHLSPPDDTVYHLACCQAEIKAQFLKSVRKAAQSCRKTARRPVSGSSHSDGGYGSEKHEEKKT
uniref:PDZ domain-containing protein n=1 Tax=Steinernema glaseri TaxID=37863 RepID=A0A1I8ABN7_9BILA